LQQLAAPLKIPALIFYRGIAHIGNCWLQQLAAPLKIPALIFYRDIAHVGNCRLQRLAAPLKIPALNFLFGERLFGSSAFESIHLVGSQVGSFIGLLIGSTN
jgi:hypothetical protein